MLVNEIKEVLNKFSNGIDNLVTTYGYISEFHARMVLEKVTLSNEYCDFGDITGGYVAISVMQEGFISLEEATEYAEKAICHFIDRLCRSKRGYVNHKLADYISKKVIRETNVHRHLLWSVQMTTKTVDWVNID